MRAAERVGGGGGVAALSVEQAEVVEDHADAVGVARVRGGEAGVECGEGAGVVALLHELQANVVVRDRGGGLQPCGLCEVEDGLFGLVVASVHVAHSEGCEGCVGIAEFQKFAICTRRFLQIIVFIR